MIGGKVLDDGERDTGVNRHVLEECFEGLKAARSWVAFAFSRTNRTALEALMRSLTVTLALVHCGPGCTDRALVRTLPGFAETAPNPRTA